jgi:hypothetical protein
MPKGAMHSTHKESFGTLSEARSSFLCLAAVLLVDYNNSVLDAGNGFVGEGNIDAVGDNIRDATEDDIRH